MDDFTRTVDSDVESGDDHPTRDELGEAVLNTDFNFDYNVQGGTLESLATRQNTRVSGAHNLNPFCALSFPSEYDFR